MVNVYYLVITFFALFLFFILPQQISAQQADPSDEVVLATHTKVDLSNKVINQNHIIEIRFSPVLRYDKFFMALDFPMQINLSDHNAIYNPSLYTNPTHYLQWINTIAFGMRKDPFEYKIGSLHGMNMGQGSLVRELHNDVLIEDKGLNIRHNFKYADFSFFLSNIANGSFGGVDLSIKPFEFFERIPLLKGIKIGASFIYDIDNKQIPYKDNINLNLNERNPDSERVLAYAAHLVIPFYNTHKLSFNGSYEYAGLLDQNQSSHYIKLLFHFPNYELNVGGAYVRNGFFFNLFSTLYLNPYERKDRIHQFGSQDGFAYFIGNKLSFFEELLTFQLDFFGQTQGSFSYYLGFNLKPGLLSNLLLGIFYVKENSNSVSQAINIINMDNAITVLQISYLFSDNARMALKYKNTFRYRFLDSKTLNDSELSFTISLLF